MDSRGLFWSTVTYLKGEAVYRLLTLDERIALEEAVKAAQITTNLQGIPTNCIQLVKQLAENIRSRSQKSWNYINNGRRL